MPVISYDDALAELRRQRPDASKTHSHRLSFGEVPGRDVYNISAPFETAGRTVIAGRVEKRDNEDSEIMFFEKQGEKYLPVPDAPVLHLQDPFFTRIDGDLVIGGVQVYPAPHGNPGDLSWRTLFYKGKDIFHLEKAFTGPEHMKDLRIAQLPSGKIAIFSRPQGGAARCGSIGYTEVDSFKDLSVEAIVNAPLLDQFTSDQWGGANEIHVLNNGKLGVLGHIAKFDNDENTRHYASCYFIYDPQNSSYTRMHMLATSDMFEARSAKRPDLVDVVFSGGLTRQPNGKAILYVGVADAEAHCIEIDDPFQSYETM